MKLKRKYRKNGSELPGVVLVTQSVIIQRIKRSSTVQRVVLVGSGSLLDIENVNGKFLIRQHDPLDKAPDNLAEFFENCSNTAVFSFYFPFGCLGLEQAGRDIADWIIEKFACMEIVVVGHGKAGVCSYNMVKNYMKGKNVKLITISTPFRGSPIASWREFSMMKKRFNFILNLIHKVNFSENMVNEDVSLSSNFIQKLRLESTADFTHVNVVTECSLVDIFTICDNFNDVLCCLMASCMKFPSDGMVSKESQRTDIYDIDYNVPHNSSMWYVMENDKTVQEMIFSR